MRLLSVAEAKLLDKSSVDMLGIDEELLMENAGRGAFEEIKRITGNVAGHLFVIAAGMGNNGGDALVIARQLLVEGADVQIFLWGDLQKMTASCRKQYQILQKMDIAMWHIDTKAGLAHFQQMVSQASFLVDGLIGSGFTGEIREDLKPVIESINAGSCVIALDIPSGVNGDTGVVGSVGIKADYTLTFGAAKQGLYLYPGHLHCGQIISVSLGVPVDFLLPDTKTQLLEHALIEDMLPERLPTGHKGSYGHVLIIGGSQGLLGAPLMAAAASVHSGAGKTSLAVPAEFYEAALQKIMPEVMLGAVTCPRDILTLCAGKTVVAIGPGLGRTAEAKVILQALLTQYNGPLIIDADALHLIDDFPALGRREAAVVLTPHPGEFAVMTGLSIDDIEGNRIETARSFAVRTGVVLVLKGAPTVIALPNGDIVVNSTGNSGMATGGMGDVLTGIIAALIGQTASIAQATEIGVYLHGLSADLLKKERPFGYTPTEVGLNMGRAVLYMRRHK